jgi:pimeloyl-ACP methyl ester carboxylesterase
MTDDGIKVVEWVTRHLGQPQVILVGHSWGSILGEHMVFARPGLFAAYVGTGQVVGWKAQVEVQYADSLARARADGDSDVLTALTKFGGPPSTDISKYREFRAVTFRDNAPADLEFFSRQASDLLTAPGVSLADVWNALQGARASMAALTPTLLTADLTELGYDFPVPFVVIQGDSDRITPTSLAVDYVNRINAPAKALVQIPDGGHYAFVTHANQFRDALVSKVLPLTRRAAPP